MAEAYRQLSAGDTVKSAAYELGFKQASHFSREFKAFHGVPPSCLLQKRLDPARSVRPKPNLPEHSPHLTNRTS
jgi:AraC-like DNA-binding protein